VSQGIRVQLGRRGARYYLAPWVRWVQLVPRVPQGISSAPPYLSNGRLEFSRQLTLRVFPGPPACSTFREVATSASTSPYSIRSGVSPTLNSDPSSNSSARLRAFDNNCRTVPSFKIGGSVWVFRRAGIYR
jgi:hypothetical protein